MSTASAAPAPKGALHLGLWVAQCFLAFAMFAAGSWKLTAPLPDLVAAGMNWVNDFGEGGTRFVAASEVLGAIGLILPSALRVQPWLTWLAAALLGVVMVLAIGVHVSDGDTGALSAPVVLGSIAFFIAWGRYRLAPIPPK